MAELLRLTTGSESPATQVRGYLPWITALAILVALRSATPSEGVRVTAHIAGDLLIVAAMVRRPRLPGALLIQLGVGLNLVVMVINAGLMPVSPVAIAMARAPSPVGHMRQLLGGRVPWLGDAIPVRPLHLVVSAGDVLLMAGLLWLVVGVANWLWRSLSAGEPVPSISQH